MSILSRYKLMSLAYSLSEISDELILNITNNIQVDNFRIKVIKFLSFLTIDQGKYSKEEILTYYKNLLIRIFVINNQDCLENEIELLATFFVARATNFYQTDIESLINISRISVPETEENKFIIMSIQYIILDLYSKIIKNSSDMDNIRNLITLLEPEEQWYSNYIIMLEQIPVTNGN